MRKQTKQPRCIVIAGPNGAGKTTFAREFLLKDAGIIHFVNAEAARVQQGGHDVPAKDVLRRFERGWTNFVKLYRPLADGWAVYDNSGATPVLIEQSS